MVASLLPKRVENVRQFFLRNARARVLHPDDHLAALNTRASNDVTARLRELDGVSDEIFEDLMNAALVGLEAGQLRRQIRRDDERPTRREGALGTHHVEDDFRQTEPLLFDGQFSLLDGGDVEKVVDETSGPAQGVGYPPGMPSGLRFVDRLEHHIHAGRGDGDRVSKIVRHHRKDTVAGQKRFREIVDLAQ
jgi:hypothetical protein